MVTVLVLGAAAIPIGGRWLGRAGTAVELHGRMADEGGWTPDVLEAQVGVPLQLRLTSDDVTHGFAVGRHDSAAVDVVPGKWTTTSLVFDEPGTYTFYCTRWCGPNHWRMRGTIEVTGSPSFAPTGEGVSQTIGTPRYVQLGIDLDAPVEAAMVPESTPVAQRGGQWASWLPGYALEDATYWSHSPAELWTQLRGEPALHTLSDMDVWDAVAWIWARQTTPASLAEAGRIYLQEAAAAHGETGQGDGVMVQDLPPYDAEMLEGGQTAMQPPDFTDPRRMLGTSPARLEGKMLRGGMGTGMPSYGQIYTDEQIDGLVSYIFTFVMDLGGGLAASQ